MKKNKNLDMTQGEPAKLLLLFALPMLIGSVFQMMYNMVAVSYTHLETGFVTTGMPYVLEMSGTQGSLMVHNDILEYCCEETDNKRVEKTDLPNALPLPVDAWIDAVVNGGEAPNGIDDAVALTKFMVGAYESFKTGKRYCF